MDRILASFEKQFWIWCILCTVAGLLWPTPFTMFQSTFILDVFLMAILFFTCLKIDFASIARELRNWPFIAYTTFIVLVAMPLITYPLVRLILPAWAIGFLIIAAAPAGMASGALTELCRGNTPLALAITTVTSILCPFTIPPIIKLLAGTATSPADLLRQSVMLMILIFVPLVLAQVFKKIWPAFTARHRSRYTALAIISLCLLILGAMSKNSAVFRDHLKGSLLVLAGVFVFSAFFHVLGFAAPLRRGAEDRAAVSICTAYVNNGLAIVFAMKFFENNAYAVLPAILIEFPMILLILPLRRLTARLREKA